MVPLIHVDRRPRDSAGERAGEERGGGADFPSGEWLREGSVGAVVLHHLLDLADRAGGARGERAAEIVFTRTPYLRPASNASVRVSLSSAALADDIPPP